MPKNIFEKFIPEANKCSSDQKKQITSLPSNISALSSN